MVDVFAVTSFELDEEVVDPDDELDLACTMGV
jgi:hypothetical protein